MANHEMRTHLDRLRVDWHEARASIKRQQLGARFAIQSQIEAPSRADLMLSPGEHGVSEAAAGKPARHGQAMNVKGFALCRMWPEQPVFIMQVHASDEHAVDTSDDKLALARDAGQLVKSGFFGAPKRLALGDQPVRGLADQRIRLGDGFHSGAGDDEVHLPTISPWPGSPRPPSHRA